MKTAVAGVSAVRAVSSFVSPAIHTDTLLVNVISSAGVTMKNVAVSAFALPAGAWVSAPTATESRREPAEPLRAPRRDRHRTLKTGPTDFVRSGVRLRN